MVLNRQPNVTLYVTLANAYHWLGLWRVMIVFFWSRATWGTRKCLQPRRRARHNITRDILYKYRKILFYCLVENVCLNKHDFLLDNELALVRHRLLLSGKSIITLLTLYWRALNSFAINRESCTVWLYLSQSKYPFLWKSIVSQQVLILVGPRNNAADHSPIFGVSLWCAEEVRQKNIYLHAQI